MFELSKIIIDLFFSAFILLQTIFFFEYKKNDLLFQVEINNYEKEYKKSKEAQRSKLKDFIEQKFANKKMFLKDIECKKCYLNRLISKKYKNKEINLYEYHERDLKKTYLKYYSLLNIMIKLFFIFLILTNIFIIAVDLIYNKSNKLVVNMTNILSLVVDIFLYLLSLAIDKNILNYIYEIENIKTST